MIWRTGLAIFLATVLSGAPALACSPAPVDPPLRGESNEAYRARVNALQRERAASWKKQRQEYALQGADLIFIARDTLWYPPSQTRSGRPVVPFIQYPAPSYFKPLAWLKGPKTTDLFQLRPDNTSCGPMGIGDTTHSQPGQLFVFFARKGRVTKDTLIDAIALDAIDNPALTAFVAKHRHARR